MKELLNSFCRLYSREEMSSHSQLSCVTEISVLLVLYILRFIVNGIALGLCKSRDCTELP